MHLGVLILPEFPWATAKAVWRQAETLGFEHAWTYDHLACLAVIPRLDPVRGSSPLTAAMVTRRIRLGTLVASPNFRHPVPFAKEFVALDDISGGRLMLGIGAGGSGWDATMRVRQPSRRESEPIGSWSSSSSSTSCCDNRRRHTMGRFGSRTAIARARGRWGQGGSERGSRTDLPTQRGLRAGWAGSRFATLPRPQWTAS